MGGVIKLFTLKSNYVNLKSKFLDTSKYVNYTKNGYTIVFKFPLLCFVGFGENEVRTFIVASPMTVLLR